MTPWVPYPIPFTQHSAPVAAQTSAAPDPWPGTLKLGGC